MPATGVVSKAQSSISMVDAKDLPGKYGFTGEVYDPLNLSQKYDVVWLREAELKHGRICMMATLGYGAVDMGLRFPGEGFAKIPDSLHAHDMATDAGYMTAFLAIMAVFELGHLSVLAPRYDGDWSDHSIGDYYLPLNKGLATDYRRETELKNGRAAMLGFSGMVTANVLQACPGASWEQVHLHGGVEKFCTAASDFPYLPL